MTDFFRVLTTYSQDSSKCEVLNKYNKNPQETISTQIINLQEEGIKTALKGLGVV